ncbi:hypothetical protein SAMN06265365_12213 [Tistlia consotensis]|uniref:DUF3349 domain-containing protein n=1 Tax=Tistlia consotensis USBA 355 TaxID=560819 RepID=A0A1Y6CLU1_9PROT|nr:hypothetical protein [Tistlia consotensis]SMF62422.1 hypothetical protein SAMN05428998_12413 [Tistlia consotensis USBA 355]SNR94681.1 hypothetical protein SAMN06265365_12213 [Tistlia consotensis]
MSAPLPERPAPEDPGGLVLEVLRMGPEFPGPAQDLLLAWTLKLPDGLDMKAAAARLLEAYDLAEGPPPDDPRGRLIALLREAASAEPPARGRRGGWRGRSRPAQG